MKCKYIRIKRHGGSSYVQRVDQFTTALHLELDDLDDHPKGITLTFSPAKISDAQYEALPVFAGHRKERPV